MSQTRIPNFLHTSMEHKLMSRAHMGQAEAKRAISGGMTPEIAQHLSKAEEHGRLGEQSNQAHNWLIDNDAVYAHNNSVLITGRRLAHQPQVDRLYRFHGEPVTSGLGRAEGIVEYP